MHRTFLALTLSLSASFAAHAEPRASSPGEVSRALGGDYWRPAPQRAPPSPTTADAAKTAPRQEPPLDVEARGAGGGLVLPEFDMDVECGRPGKNNIGRNTCLELEQAAYDNLNLVWDQLPIDVKDTCRSFPTYKSVRYRRIAICVSAEMDKLKHISDQTEHRRFRY